MSTIKEMPIKFIQDELSRQKGKMLKLQAAAHQWSKISTFPYVMQMREEMIAVAEKYLAKAKALPEPGSFDDFWNDNERIVENTDDENEPTIGYWIEERMIEEN